jgi:hypothetical protein
VYVCTSNCLDHHPTSRLPKLRGGRTINRGVHDILNDLEYVTSLARGVPDSELDDESIEELIHIFEKTSKFIKHCSDPGSIVPHR